MDANDTFPGGFVSEFYGVDSEVGRLRTVLVHRPGAELRRVTPQQACGMLLPGPAVGRTGAGRARRVRRRAARSGGRGALPDRVAAGRA